MGKAALIDNVQSELEMTDGKACEAVAHSVLYHLWRQMPFHQRERMLDALPLDVKELLMEPKSPKEPPLAAEDWSAEGPLENASYDFFCMEVREETHLAGDGEDEAAIHAVFSALKDELPEDEVMHIQERLPQGLKQTWATAYPV